MDLIITLALIYSGYRLWKWYDGLKKQLGQGRESGPEIRRNQDPDTIDIDYEEID
ncbi:MAG: hypothetical protein AAFR97_02395 [Bacteroidota bacterium]